MSATSRQRGFLAFIAMSAMILFSRQAVVGLSSSNTKSVYSILYQSTSIDLNRGQTFQLSAQVFPGDLPVSFPLGSPDSRVNVSAGTALGTQRTLTITDLTTAGDGSANTPDILSISPTLAYNPAQIALGNNIQALDLSGKPLQVTINLKKPFMEAFQNVINDPTGSIQTSISLIPPAICAGVAQGAASAYNSLADQQNPPVPHLTAAQQQQIQAEINSIPGNTVCADYATAVNTSINNTVATMDSTQATTPVARSTALSASPKFTANFTYTAFTINSQGGVSLQPSEFVSPSGWSLTTSPITTNTPQLSANASLKSASFSVQISGATTLNYSSPGGNLTSNANVSIQFSFTIP